MDIVILDSPCKNQAEILKKIEIMQQTTTKKRHAKGPKNIQQ